MKSIELKSDYRQTCAQIVGTTRISDGEFFNKKAVKKAEKIVSENSVTIMLHNVEGAASVTFVRYIYAKEKAEWTPGLTKKVSIPKSRVVNCFQFDDGKILLLLSQHVLIIESDFNEVAQVKFISPLLCCRPSHGQSNNFWMVFERDDEG